ncbi:MAG TPA: phage tail protein [Pyrinomonadaceae bacterium]|jgi:phage tail-like protein|nr:phage tail protein [Pyrinomonadaceae bacterium]
MSRRISDPYAGFNFLVEIDNVRVAGFSECSGLQVEIKTFDYKEGGRNNSTLKFPEHASYGNVTLKRGVTLSNDLIDWQLDMAEDGRATVGNFAIILKDETGEPVKRWNLIRAFPVKWTGPDLKANASEIAIESLEIAHEGIQVR